MKYRPRYKIRDWLFRLLFPTIASHMSHLVDDLIDLEVKNLLVHTPESCNYAVQIATGTVAETIYREYDNGV